jgi:hypothetical protein
MLRRLTTIMMILIVPGLMWVTNPHPEATAQPVSTPPTRDDKVVWTSYFSVSANEPPAWAQTIRRTHAQEMADSLLKAANVINTFTPTRSGSENFIKYIEKDNGAAWKKYVQEQAVQAAKVQKKTGHVFYWLVGNEISSPLQQKMWYGWAGKPAPKGEKNDPFILPLYAEYFLAPTVEALNKAGKETGVTIPIVLGSLGTGASKANRDWYDKLIAYEFKADHAPSLKGKKVMDVVDYIAYHYTIDGPGWEASLDDFRKWIGKGSIKGMFDTEELGNQTIERKVSGAIAIRAFARYLYWWDKHGMTPEQGRVNYWAWNKGGDTSAATSMAVLYDFLGKTSLRTLKTPTVTGERSAEAYAFEVEQGDKRVVVVLGPRSGSLALKTVSLQAQEWKGKPTGEVHVFSAKGHTKSVATVQPDRGGCTITLSSEVKLSDEATAVFLLSNR